MSLFTAGIGVLEVALIAALTGAAIGFAIGVWFTKKTLESKVDSLLDFGSEETVMDLSGVVEEND